MSASEELVPSVSIAALVLRRDGIVERLRQAHVALVEAEQLAEALFGDEMRGHRMSVLTSDHQSFTSDRGIEYMTKEVDGRAWSYLLRVSGLQTFMDAKARDEWNKAIERNDVPPLTTDNIHATFSALHQGRGEMFERGVVAVFRSLSWDYKTNNPVMFGKRIILRNVVDVWAGGGCFGPSHHGANKLDDLVRVLSVLDGKPEPDYRSACYRRLTEIQWMRGSGPNFATLDYFTLKGFKNGNGHLTFTRPELVDKMNAIVARHFPGALPPHRE